MDSSHRHLVAALVLGALLLCAGSIAAADPVPFDWRLIACDCGESACEPPAATGPNPVVLPMPEESRPATARGNRGSGWHWLRPQLASNPGSNSSRTAVRLANSEQERELARRNAMMDGILPGALSGLAPLAIESGIEWRF